MVLPKNLIRPLPMQDHKNEWLWRPAFLFAGACMRSGWSKLRRHHSSEERKNPNWIRSCFGRGRWVTYIEDPTTSRCDRIPKKIGFQSFVLLLEGSGLVRLVVVPFVLATWELLDHVSAGLALIFFLRCILLPSLLLNIKSCYQVFN